MELASSPDCKNSMLVFFPPEEQEGVRRHAFPTVCRGHAKANLNLVLSSVTEEQHWGFCWSCPISLCFWKQRTIPPLDFRCEFSVKHYMQSIKQATGTYWKMQSTCLSVALLVASVYTSLCVSYDSSNLWWWWLICQMKWNRCKRGWKAGSKNTWRNTGVFL